MLSEIQRLKGISATLTHLEERIKAYRALLAATISQQLPSSDIEDAAVTDGEIETVEILIVQLAKLIIGSEPDEGAWESFHAFSSRNEEQKIDSGVEQQAEHIRCALQWVQKTRTFVTYLSGVISVGAERPLTADLPIGLDVEMPSVPYMEDRTNPFGQYFGDLHLNPLPDGRLMRLAKPFGFLDARKKRWPVPAETDVDGASIPQALWSLIGGPFEGKYRNASVIHDYYCDTRLEPWRDVHRMFYEAMRASGVSPSRAKLMYAAVYFAGPRWPDTVIHNVNVPRIDDRGHAFYILHSRFEEDIYATIEVEGHSAAELVTNKNMVEPSGPETRLHLDQVEEVIQGHDPTLSEIDRAIDQAVSILGESSSDRVHVLVLQQAKTPPIFSEVISFRDASVEAVIRESINKPDGAISRSDMEGITGLDFRDRPVRSLIDLRYCTSLRILSLEGTSVDDISALSALTTLETLSVNRTQTTDLSPLVSLTALRELFAGKTNVSDISPLAALTQLKLVSLAYSPVSDIQPLLDLRRSGGLKKGRVMLWGVALSWEARNVQVPMLAAWDVEVSV